MSFRFKAAEVVALHNCEAYCGKEADAPYDFAPLKSATSSIQCMEAGRADHSVFRCCELSTGKGAGAQIRSSSTSTTDVMSY